MHCIWRPSSSSAHKARAWSSPPMTSGCSKPRAPSGFPFSRSDSVDFLDAHARRRTEEECPGWRRLAGEDVAQAQVDRGLSRGRIEVDQARKLRAARVVVLVERDLPGGPLDLVHAHVDTEPDLLLG